MGNATTVSRAVSCPSAATQLFKPHFDLGGIESSRYIPDMIQRTHLLDAGRIQVGTWATSTPSPSEPVMAIDEVPSPLIEFIGRLAIV